jgi:hypothetical protein
MGSTVAPGVCLKIRELVAFSTATDLKRRRVVACGSPLRILDHCPVEPPLRAVSLRPVIIHYSVLHGRKAMDRGLLLLLIGAVLPIIVLLFLLWRYVF